MTSEEFVPLARTMITMVYRRHYEGQSADEWLELNSTKFGAFLLNKNTGETHTHREREISSMHPAGYGMGVNTNIPLQSDTPHMPF